MEKDYRPGPDEIYVAEEAMSPAQAHVSEEREALAEQTVQEIERELRDLRNGLRALQVPVKRGRAFSESGLEVRGRPARIDAVLAGLRDLYAQVGRSEEFDGIVQTHGEALEMWRRWEKLREADKRRADVPDAYAEAFIQALKNLLEGLRAVNFRFRRR